MVGHQSDGLLCTSYALPDTLHEVAKASPSAISAGLFLGIGSTAIGYTAWAVLMRRGGAGGGTSIFYAVPIVTTALEWALLSTHPSAVGVAGGLLAVAGVLYGRTDRRRTAPSGVAPIRSEQVESESADEPLPRVG